MCIASSGVIIEKKGRTAVVDLGGNKIEAEAGLTECEAGDHVLIHAGCIIQKLTKAEADEMEDIMRLIGDME